MNKLSRAAQILTAAGLTIGLLGVAAPANAERYSVDDPADASASLNDIHAFTYVHGKATVRFVIDVEDLRAPSTAGATVFFDTRGGRKGPEFGLGTGLGSGTDYALFRTTGFKASNDHRVNCDYSIKLRFKTDKVVGTIARDCFGNPKQLRASVKMVDVDDDVAVTDWAPGTRLFGLRVAAG